MSSEASILNEYTIRTITETWVNKVLGQLVRLEKFYETDEVILQVAYADAQLYQKFNIDQITDDLLRQKTTVSINMGLGATDPMRRISTLMGGVKELYAIPGMETVNVDRVELFKEVLSARGYADGGRFLPKEEQEDPRIQELTAQLSEMQSIIDTKQVEQQGKVQIEQMRDQGKKEIAIMRNEVTLEVERMRGQIRLLEIDIIGEESDTKRGELLIQRDALLHDMLIKEYELGIGGPQKSNGASSAAPGKGGTMIRGDYGSIPHAVG